MKTTRHVLCIATLGLATLAGPLAHAATVSPDDSAEGRQQRMDQALDNWRNRSGDAMERTGERMDNAAWTTPLSVPGTR